MGLPTSAVRPIPSPVLTWEELRAELPRLVGWVVEHGDKVLALAERIRVGRERLQEAIRLEDDAAVEAIARKLDVLSTEIQGLDHTARRLGVVRALLYLRDMAGPCDVHAVVPDAKLDIKVAAS